MGNTYTQIHIHIIFAVKFRSSLINNKWKSDLYKYIIGIIKKQNHKPIIINGTENHIHLLIGYKPFQSLSELVQDIKGSSSKWINDNNLTNTKFNWQEGYGAFSYSLSQLPRVINYIKTQEEHHKKKTFSQEYKSFLDAFKVNYKDKYLLKEPE